MRISSIFSLKGSFSLAILFGATIFSYQPLGFIDAAQAQSHHHKGGVFIGKRAQPRQRVNRRVTNRSGVRLGKQRIRRNNNNFNIIKRQRLIERRNVRAQRQNDQRRLRSSVRRSGPNGRFLNRQEKDLILLEALDRQIFDDGASSGVIRNSNSCPSSHNCGYRIYSDGTGPRIITPSSGRNNNLPAFDGLNGPKVITLD